MLIGDCILFICGWERIVSAERVHVWDSNLCRSNYYLLLYSHFNNQSNYLQTLYILSIYRIHHQSFFLFLFGCLEWSPSWWDKKLLKHLIREGSFREFRILLVYVCGDIYSACWVLLACVLDLHISAIHTDDYNIQDAMGDILLNLALTLKWIQRSQNAYQVHSSKLLCKLILKLIIMYSSNCFYISILLCST